MQSQAEDAQGLLICRCAERGPGRAQRSTVPTLHQKQALPALQGGRPETCLPAALPVRLRVPGAQAAHLGSHPEPCHLPAVWPRANVP